MSDLEVSSSTGKVTVGPASHWPRVTELRRLCKGDEHSGLWNICHPAVLNRTISTVTLFSVGLIVKGLAGKKVPVSSYGTC